MKKLVALFSALVLLTGVVFADTKPKAKRVVNADLVSLLPASDAVATVNLKRLMSEVMPALLNSQPEKLAEMYAKIDEIKAKTGIDLRQYEQAAIGMNFKQLRPGVMSAEPVVLLRGTFSANALLIAGKLAAKNKYRQEKIGGKTVLIFTLPETAKDAVKEAGKKDDNVGKMLEQLGASMNGEVAAVALDANTLAFGKPEQVRGLLTTKTAVSADLKIMLNRNPNAVLSFAGNAPENASALMKLGDDQFSQILNSMKQVYGSLDMNAGNVAMTLAARTAKETEAQELEGILQELRNMGKGFFSLKSSEQNQIFLRILDTVKVTRSLSEVQLQMEVSQSDLNALMVKAQPAAQK